jgi:acyl phosphate:glycerol-3-phosphate acyltransferase
MIEGASVLVVVAGFLLGSIPFPYLLTRRRGIDLRRVGSGNVGAANVLRVSSPATAMTVLALDATKGSLAVWMADAITRQSTVAICAGLAAIAGHVYPPWLGFRGGKGMATTAGVFALLAPAATLGAAAVFVLLIALSRVVSVGSIGAMLALPPLTAWFAGSPAVVIGACAATVFVAFRHRSNVRRLWLGTERRLGQGL